MDVCSDLLKSWVHCGRPNTFGKEVNVEIQNIKSFKESNENKCAWVNIWVWRKVRGETGPVRAPSEGSSGNDTLNHNESFHWELTGMLMKRWHRTHFEHCVRCLDFRGRPIHWPVDKSASRYIDPIDFSNIGHWLIFTSKQLTSAIASFRIYGPETAVAPVYIHRSLNSGTEQ